MIPTNVIAVASLFFIISNVSECAQVDEFLVEPSLGTPVEIDVKCFWEMDVENEDFHKLVIKLNGTAVYTWDQKNGKKPEVNNNLGLQLEMKPQRGRFVIKNAGASAMGMYQCDIDYYSNKVQKGYSLQMEGAIQVYMDNNHVVRNQTVDHYSPNTAKTSQGISSIVMTLFLIFTTKVMNM
ncbi:unnamed protein product [Oppiella nova]|uniref:Uncharacterized protein n=1 Tax=Oppiella nova TaxID=334625 RepID=A0A7R9LG67_9ACAR|nr:unnamed protein product [Oppiella nova]CAG2162877.1 unnamed protein product [Oppiella nova]